MGIRVPGAQQPETAENKTFNSLIFECDPMQMAFRMISYIQIPSEYRPDIQMAFEIGTFAPLEYWTSLVLFLCGPLY